MTVEPPIYEVIPKVKV